MPRNAKRPSLASARARLARIDRRKPASRQLIALLRQAAAFDDDAALEELGMYLRDGLNDRRGRTILHRNAKASIGCYRRAAELGNRSAMDALATALSEPWMCKGRRPPKSRDALEEAFRWYRKAIHLGFSAYNLAVTYQNLGQHAKAVAWFRKTAATGEIGALLPLAQAELYGIGTRRDVPAALAKLRRVAGTTTGATGAVSFFAREEAMRTIAQVLSDGWLVRRDYRGALRWLRRAAKIGSAAADGLIRDHGEP